MEYWSTIPLLVNFIPVNSSEIFFAAFNDRRQNVFAGLHDTLPTFRIFILSGRSASIRFSAFTREAIDEQFYFDSEKTVFLIEYHYD
jgi:hypothetical protein